MTVMIMNLFYKLLIIVLTTIILPQEALILYKNNRPTPDGIDKYIETNADNFLDEYQTYVKDSIYVDVYITSTDLTKLADYDSTEMGRTEIMGNSYEVIIGNHSKFRDYSLAPIKTDNITKQKKQKHFNQSDQFVKSAIIHELTHIYFRQEMMILSRKDSLNKFYYNVYLMPNPERRFGSEFIEEGICEYVTRSKGEILKINDLFIPKTVEDITSRKTNASVKYAYSSYYIKNFLDSTTLLYGKLKYGIDIILRNNPPNYREILNPKLYFNRLN